MDLGKIFAKKEYNWGNIRKNNSLEFSLFEGILRRLNSKIHHLQELILSIENFKNSHFFEDQEQRILNNSDISIEKLYERYKKIHKNLIKKLFLELKIEKKDYDEAIATNISNISMISSKLESEFYEDSQIISSEFSNLKDLLISQINILKKIDFNFDLFIGDKKRWENDYSDLSSKSSNYLVILENKEEKFKNWEAYIGLILEFKNKIKEEVSIISGIKLGEDISTWEFYLRENLEKSKIYSKLLSVKISSEKLISYETEKKIILYHITENPFNIFPLSEKRFPNGFFVCINDKNYGYIIKSAQIQPQAQLRDISFRIPKSLFLKLFHADFNYGNDRIPMSKEAYEHSFFIPVSKYSEFNKYVFLKLIK